MTEQTDAAEVEALVRLFVSHQRIPTFEGLGHRCVGCNHLEGESDGSNSPRVAKHIAELVLASDWLAAREAAARAEERERVAVAIEAMPLMDRWGYLDGKRLRDAAARIARTDGAGS